MSSTAPHPDVLAAVESVEARSDWFQWARHNQLYISRDDLLASTSTIIVDVRDEDAAGGHITGALHRPDSRFSVDTVQELVEISAREHATQVVFHCMESARRAPRCARRMTLALEAMRECDIPAPAIQVRVLEGGFDQWVRRYWDAPDKVNGYDDEYWGYVLMGGTQLLGHDEPGHALYERPADQPETEWSAAGSDVI